MPLPFVIPAALSIAALRKSPLVFAIVATAAACAAGAILFFTWLHFHDKALVRARDAEIVAEAYKATAEAQAKAVTQREARIKQQEAEARTASAKLKEVEDERDALREKAKKTDRPTDAIPVDMDWWMRNGTKADARRR